MHCSFFVFFCYFWVNIAEYYKFLGDIKADTMGNFCRMLLSAANWKQWWDTLFKNLTAHCIFSSTEKSVSFFHADAHYAQAWICVSAYFIQENRTTQIIHPYIEDYKLQTTGYLYTWMDQLFQSFIYESIQFD